MELFDGKSNNCLAQMPLSLTCHIEGFSFSHCAARHAPLDRPAPPSLEADFIKTRCNPYCVASRDLNILRVLQRTKLPSEFFAPDHEETSAQAAT